MQNENKHNCKYVFVCGLQRSGTSVLARNIGRLEDCTAFKNTGVLQDEGQYLQDVYPPDVECGGTGAYGFDPRSHLTEASPLLTSENIIRLHMSWHSYWDNSKQICIEKTPSNLIMTRFLQAAFSNSYFVVIRRHPVPVSMASQKWSMSSLHRLFEHWLRCYELFDQDKKYLRRVYELTYEDYIANPARHHEKIATFVGTNVPAIEMEAVSAAYNEKYLQHWSNLLSNSPFRAYYRYIAHSFEPRFANYNYSLLDWNGTTQLPSLVAPRAAGLAYCSLADAVTFIWRLHGRKFELLTKPIRSILPRALKDEIKHALQRRQLHWAARLLMPRWFAGIRKNVS
jgi:hypothetical protein